MSDPFLGQIIMTAFGFAPRQYALCDGQIYPIGQHQALFSLLGTRFGGNGATNFALPNLQGRTPVGAGPSMDSGWTPPPVALGLPYGTEIVTLLTPQIPPHTHGVSGSHAQSEDGSPGDGETFAVSVPAVYGQPTNLVPLAGGPTSISGRNLPHNNVQPSLVVSMAIALGGTYPQRG